VRHKDVKASNVLLKAGPRGTILMFTDFGIALDFSDVANSMSNGPKPLRTLRYCAPEVAHARIRGRRSDVFSLGCLFLEVVTVLAGHSLYDLEDALDEDGNFHENEQQILSWLKTLGEEEMESTRLPLRWIRPMMQRRPDQRPHAREIVDAMANDTKSRRELRDWTFCDLCIDELKIQKKITLTQSGQEEEDIDSDYDVGK
jgi:serine/threonine protein kinase